MASVDKFLINKIMPSTRIHDQTITEAPARTERLFSRDELWYFRTRENDRVGPFRYRSEAQSNLDKFLNELRDKL
ncbi:MAG: hypothetical protein JKY98_08895 [Gammaproteobacteria bacterium]|nr:hypothetical protein [Gammaproteobacteria bacterium]